MPAPTQLGKEGKGRAEQSVQEVPQQQQVARLDYALIDNFTLRVILKLSHQSQPYRYYLQAIYYLAVGLQFVSGIREKSNRTGKADGKYFKCKQSSSSSSRLAPVGPRLCQWSSMLKNMSTENLMEHFSCSMTACIKSSIKRCTRISC